MLENEDEVTILILVDGFLQYIIELYLTLQDLSHNPYFSRWFSAIKALETLKKWLVLVTILILVDGFLQYSRYSRIFRL